MPAQKKRALARSLLLPKLRNRLRRLAEQRIQPVGKFVLALAQTFPELPTAPQLHEERRATVRLSCAVSEHQRPGGEHRHHGYDRESSGRGKLPSERHCTREEPKDESHEADQHLVGGAKPSLRRGESRSSWVPGKGARRRGCPPAIAVPATSQRAILRTAHRAAVPTRGGYGGFRETLRAR